MSFEENLRTLRLARGLTQPVLAEKASIEQSYLSKLENGRSKPSEEVLTRLAQALEVKPETLQQNGDEAEDRRRLWIRLGFSAVAVVMLVGVFLLGRATAIYPLNLSQVFSGARAGDDTTQQFLAMAPREVVVIQLARSGHGDRISISGRSPDTASVEAYMQALRKNFGGSFVTISISPTPGSDSLHAFQLEYLAPGPVGR
ncbi:MAG TPA: helix-turn-helix transcriptional regulator [Gammaproteobacteria bacterium]|nr:helix-turn-helix transcriptional regulator [Gammaproteobacteria bacterium]